ncbi:endoplasmic reticulum lectin 1 isoform X1 [Lutzomyia longipalpis]|uniref:Endoplasmic reticulum lectin 1 n=1 Tax=Lutzomyia longipalpis TaxID=7200 RepID=A0A7G3ABS9_LUTLO|nr:endoplasmic reticulum lectin 1 isoform X1 [Lutzomyia longipalpis]
MQLSVQIVLLLWLHVGVSLEPDLKGFDDNILYKINWPGKIDDLQDAERAEPMFVTTSKKEKYRCMIPPIQTVEDTDNSPYMGPAPLDLLMPLFASAQCSIRIESYWTYEVCHGLYVKQFHEERDGKSVKTQEYHLGRWDWKNEALREKIMQAEQEKGDTLQYKKIDSLNLPYFELEMTDGTICDINNEPRVTKVLYVCYAHGKNAIYSLKETSTCNYEMIILTPNLCSHPKFRPQEAGDNNINCYPVDGPAKPRDLLAMEVESMKLRYQKLSNAHQNAKDTIAVFKVDAKDGTLRMEILQNDFDEDDLSAALEGTTKKITKTTDTITDTTPVEAFLQGKHCLTGGTGWWRYEFCYGRYVRQYHGDTSLILGFFDEKLHREWIEKHPHKRPKPKNVRTELTHFYQGGSECDKTGERRETEVKLKCLENATSKTSVSLYLLEPQTCQYILGVESPLICEILQKADDDGLVASLVSQKAPEKGDEEHIVGNAIIEDIDVRFEND